MVHAGLEERSLEAKVVAVSTGGQGGGKAVAVSFPCGLVADGLQVREPA